jgi:hypothetical protein
VRSILFVGKTVCNVLVMHGESLQVRGNTNLLGVLKSELSARIARSLEME